MQSATDTRGPQISSLGSAGDPGLGSLRSYPAANRLRGLARLAVALELFLGVGALFGGAFLILAPDGHLLGMTTSTLSGSPFSSYLLPGIILFAVIGVGPILAAAITVQRRALAPLAAVAVGVVLVGWISVEMVVLAGAGSLAWALYLVLGTAIAAVGVSWRRA